MTGGARHCLDVLREGDRDRYLASLFVPEAKRAHVVALYAFDLEISRIPRLVSTPQLGEIRQQWWLETVDGIYERRVAAHPVAEQLSEAIAAAHLPRETLRNLILARQFDLYADAMPTLGDLEGYLGETRSALIQLAAMIVAETNAAAVAEAAGFAGVAEGIAHVLCSGRARAYLPRDTTAAQGEAGAFLLLIQHGRRRLAEARQRTIGREAFPAFLSAGLAELYFDRLEKAGLSVLEAPLEVARFRRQWHLWRLARREKL